MNNVLGVADTVNQKSSLFPFIITVQMILHILV